MDRRKVLFTAGMSNDKQIIITDAPIEDIEKWCYRCNESTENGEIIESFDILKTQYYVKELHDSEIDDNEDIEVIGYDEVYDLFNYYLK